MSNAQQMIVSLVAIINETPEVPEQEKKIGLAALGLLGEFFSLLERNVIANEAIANTNHNNVINIVNDAIKRGALRIG